VDLKSRLLQDFGPTFGHTNQSQTVYKGLLYQLCWRRGCNSSRAFYPL